MGSRLHDLRLDDAVLGEVLEASQVARAEDLPRVLMEVAAQLGAIGIYGYIIDYQQTVLVPLPGGPASTVSDELAAEGTLAGRAFTHAAPVLDRSREQPTLWLPMGHGAARLGVLEVVFARSADIDSGAVARYRRLGTLVAELIARLRLTGDAIERVRRRGPMLMPAEIQWNLLPPLTHATDRIVISGILEPCYEVAGDTFDYAIDGDLAHLAIFDAMGHGLGSALLATLAIGAYRNARRTGLDLVDTYHSIDRWVSAHVEGSFVTGILGQIDLSTGHYRWITAGHPPALLLRDNRVVKMLKTPPTLPMGLGEGTPAVETEELEAGDRLLYYTDGVTEARDEAGEFFGVDRLTELVTREASAQLPAPETLRRLNLAILEHQAGNLDDDATTLPARRMADPATASAARRSVNSVSSPPWAGQCACLVRRIVRPCRSSWLGSE